MLPRVPSGCQAGTGDLRGGGHNAITSRDKVAPSRDEGDPNGAVASRPLFDLVEASAFIPTRLGSSLRRQSPEVICEPESHSYDRQSWIRDTSGWKYGAACDVQIREIV